MDCCRVVVAVSWKLISWTVSRAWNRELCWSLLRAFSIWGNKLVRRKQTSWHSDSATTTMSLNPDIIRVHVELRQVVTEPRAYSYRLCICHPWGVCMQTVIVGTRWYVLLFCALWQLGTWRPAGCWFGHHEQCVWTVIIHLLSCLQQQPQRLNWQLSWLQDLIYHFPYRRFVRLNPLPSESRLPCCDRYIRCHRLLAVKPLSPREHAGRRLGKGGTLATYRPRPSWFETAVVQTERHPITWSRVTACSCQR